MSESTNITCFTCDGSGMENHCIDDLCQGDTCIHGDGYMTCSACHGLGYVEFDGKHTIYEEDDLARRSPLMLLYESLVIFGTKINEATERLKKDN